MAKVTLVVGLTYSHKNRTFIKDQPLVITGSDLDYFRNNGHFRVEEDPRPVAPRRAVPRLAPEPEEVEEAEVVETEPEEEVLAGDPTEEELQAAEEAEQQLATPTPAKKPVPRKGQFLKGGKRA